MCNVDDLGLSDYLNKSVNQNDFRQAVILLLMLPKLSYTANQGLHSNVTVKNTQQHSKVFKA